MTSLKKHIYLIGMPGSGKSSLGRRVATSLRLPYVDTDNLLAQIFKKDTKTILQEYGEPAFRNAETNLLIRLCAANPCIISTGGGLPLKEINQKIMKDNGYVILIDRPLDSIKSNIRFEKRPLLMGDGMKKLEQINEIRMPIYKSCADYTFNNLSNISEGINSLSKVILSQMS